MLGGNDTVTINGQAMVGDIATCALGRKNCKGQGPIIVVEPRNMAINGRLVARYRDRVACGCHDNFLLATWCIKRDKNIVFL